MYKKKTIFDKPFTSQKQCRVMVNYYIQRHKWIMHEHDSDINDPSCPHLHAIGVKWKMDIYTGCMYLYPNKIYMGRATKKEMKKLWSQRSFVDLVIRERKWYESEFHSKDPVRYPELPKISVVRKHNKFYMKVSKMSNKVK